MNCKPITEVDIWDMLNTASSQMTSAQERLWEAIRILPVKWQQHPYGDRSGGFWVLGIIGRRAIWYNDIEGGFNISQYSRYGIIDEYLCNQDKLEWAIQRIMNFIQLGYEIGPSMGPPQPGEYSR
ncbi:MAG TPA: hypothetical protein VK558_11680 [Patescibacteria group bacterium]|nr:hypothetical protein [Patescibacteria group bacterium]